MHVWRVQLVCCNIGGLEKEDESETDEDAESDGSEKERTDDISFQYWCRQDKKVNKVKLTIDFAAFSCFSKVV